MARLHFRFPRSDSARNQHSATVRVYRNAILKGNAIESRALYYEKNKNGTTNDLLFRLFFRLLLISHKEMSDVSAFKRSQSQLEDQIMGAKNHKEIILKGSID